MTESIHVEHVIHGSGYIIPLSLYTLGMYLCCIVTLFYLYGNAFVGVGSYTSTVYVVTFKFDGFRWL